MPEEFDESQLLEAAANGCVESVGALFDRYYPMIHAFAYRLTFSQHDAEDIAQETFINAARSLATFRRDASFKNWLYKIATNRHCDFVRRQRRQENVPLTEDIVEHADETADFTALHQALDALPDDWRRAVTLVYYEERSHAETAKILGCAETTVSWRIFRAKRQLKKHLQRL